MENDKNLAVETVEQITEDTNFSVFESEIDFYFKFFCTRHGIDDMTTAPQNKFYAALMFCYAKIFKDNKDRLKDKTPYNNYKNNIPELNNYSDCNRYNYILLNALADYYLFLCTIYDKDPSIWGFSMLTGINIDTLYSWGAEDGKLNPARHLVYEKLYKGRESALVAKLTSNKNPVATIAVLNKHYGYNMAGVPAGGNSKQLTADQLPKLVENNPASVNVHNDLAIQENNENS